MKKNDLEKTFLEDMEIDNFIHFLNSLDIDNLDDRFSDIKYSLIFNNDVLSFLQEDDVMENITNYIEQYKKVSRV